MINQAWHGHVQKYYYNNYFLEHELLLLLTTDCNHVNHWLESKDMYLFLFVYQLDRYCKLAISNRQRKHND